MLKVSKESDIIIPDDLMREMEGLKEWEEHLEKRETKKRIQKEKTKQYEQISQRWRELSKHGSLLKIG